MNRRDLLKYTASVLGVSATSSLMLGALAGCGKKNEAGSQPILLKDHRRKLIESITEMIIPETDTPGAIEAGVPDFIDQIVADWYTETEREIFLAGLKDIDKYCVKEFNQGFVACDQQQKTLALQAFEKLAADYKPKSRSMFDRSSSEDTPFFSKIKELTVFGYYTSEVGAKQALSYLPMPGRYIGNYPLSKVGKAWSS